MQHGGHQGQTPACIFESAFSCQGNHKYFFCCCSSLLLFVSKNSGPSAGQRTSASHARAEREAVQCTQTEAHQEKVLPPPARLSACFVRSADLPTGLLLVSSVDTVGLRCAIARRTLVAVAVVVILVDLHIGAAETGFVFTTRRRSGPFGCVDLVRAVGAAAYPLKSGQRNPRGCIQRRLSLTRVSLQPEEKAPPQENGL